MAYRLVDRGPAGAKRGIEQTQGKNWHQRQWFLYTLLHCLSLTIYTHTHTHTCTSSPRPTPVVYCVHDLRNHSHTCNMYSTVQYSTYTRSDLMPEMYLSALQIVCAPPDSVKIHGLLWCGLFVHHHKRFHLGVCLETFPTIRDTITLWTLNVVFFFGIARSSESAELLIWKCQAGHNAMFTVYWMANFPNFVHC